jgi:MFS family permease
VATLCLVQFVDVLGVTSVLTALPAIIADLNAPAEATALLATVYAMFFGGLLVLGARLGDRYGHRRVLLVGIGVFTVVSLVGAAAQGILVVLGARALQGGAAAVSVPCALRLLLRECPEEPARGTALAAWSASGALAGVLGYLVGGVLTQTLGWRACFWVNAPIGLVLAVGVVALVQPAGRQSRRQHLDLPGAALLIVAVMAVIVGAAQIEHAELRTRGALVVLGGLLVGAVFVLQQRRAAEPLIPHSAFSTGNLRSGTVLSFVNTATTSSAGVLATLLLQQQLGATPLQAGLTLMPFSVAVVLGSLLTRPLARRLSSRRMATAGLALVAGGNLLLALTYGTLVGVVLGVTVAGTGLGIASVAATAIGTDVPEALSGSATGLLNTGAQLGTALGVAALVTLSATVGRPPGTAVAWATAALAAAATAVALGLRPRLAR